MNFDIDEDERAVVETIDALMSDRFSPARRRSALGGEHDPALWDELAYQLGMVPMAIPEAAGGDGGGAVLTGLVARSLGAALYDGPYLSCVTAIGALADSEASEAREVLVRTATGDARATLAPLSAAGGVRASPRDGGWAVSGSARGVLDATSATHIVVEAELAGDVEAEVGRRVHFLVDASDSGVAARRVESVDLLRSVGVVDFEDAAAVPLLDPASDSTATVSVRVRDRARVLLASEQIGGARAMLDSAVVYARLRHQFGRPIGGFQAIKHQLADLLVAIELAEVTVDHMLCLIDAGLPVEEGAAAALALSSDAYTSAALTGLHVHGGIGFTWESDIHLYVRRAKSSAALLGGPAEQRARVLAVLGL